MHIHILGICGTFMGSLAILAKALGHRVTGSDQNVYPPMSTQLESQGIELIQGYDPIQLEPAPDLVVVGNAMSRGNPCVEYVLDKGLTYTSGPQWLSEHLLQDRWVLAVAGTHGKTSTATMLAWILEYAGMSPGFLIGGVPQNFPVSARLGDTPFFVIEADEYDTAFFDKRSKFVHYHPRTLILNNLEYDHADIFPDLAAIQRQFHHLMRILPASGQVIVPTGQPALESVLEMGCWSERVNVDTTGQVADWQSELLAADGSAFRVRLKGVVQGEVQWSCTGLHNVNNALVAMAAAHHVGVTPEHSIAALSEFAGVKRRMELLGTVRGVRVYDDFAHHPTAIATTLEGIRNKVGQEKVIAVIEPRSNTMRLGGHQAALSASVAEADAVCWFEPAGLNWSLEQVIETSPVPARVFNSTAEIIEHLQAETAQPCHIVIMSNGGFEGIHQRLITALEQV
ncbi:UDP-N-acetylmuramate:L-alanyl-gamma-D-glutamyl-meso-diaminopimelate ligase [Neptuniibacter sp. CAU 1671]|uniref:UDP-N-acetylmuramate:L-alanyl-gamma-D-glutamyl- meso-diaminopimelate ligase n=1 Tax=Neptuniibacter sp. CAU 1671 TaxID=3032593 RepID=UPI0023DAE1B2|nr:UDP-N-acetylmuramate:L-alanyl-gamma-D-glutamyl-meso-diaminopimelate ligase [Neptuniibacter sp. CAU 1671]MDF2182236.1 UDP-N-acetylmuramate:L-alanyl-gamma-D-glutamyl-meso-diaminopimelate ligase [Neptuniibacter sp. CAU 1671]